MDESFKEIQEYPGYFVNQQGVVIGRRGKALKPAMNHRGYLLVSLSHRGERAKSLRVHRLVLMTFCPQTEIDHMAGRIWVDHINRVRTDNRLENLRWVNAFESSANRSNVDPLRFTLGGAEMLDQLTSLKELSAKSGIAFNILKDRWRKGWRDLKLTQAVDKLQSLKSKGRGGTGKRYRDKIIELRKSGISVKKIAKMIGCSRPTVTTVIKRASL